MESMTINKKYSVIILSAGKSSRMGIPKFSLKFNGETTFIENLVNEYSLYGCKEIVVVLNPDGAALLKELTLKLPSNVRVAINHHPEWERFYSLKLGAKALKISNPAFVSNIDNPFINTKVLDTLALSSDNADYMYPTFNGRGGHPFLISEKVIADLTTEPEDEIHLKAFLGRYSKRAVEVDDQNVLVNVNTDKEYRKLFRE